MQTIHVEVKNVYGEQKVYPLCHQAELFAKLAGTRTLTPQAIKLIKALGFEIIAKTAVVIL